MPPAHDFAHRRRTETEAKAKVVASVWGAKCIKFLATLAFCLGQFGRKGRIHPFLSNRPEAKQLARQGIE